MRKVSFTIVLLIMGLTNIIAQNAPKSGPCPGMPQFTDPRDGKTYNTVQIGDRCWMKENLNVGNFITSATLQTKNTILEKYCYENTEASCNTYGGLYFWDEMMQYSSTPGIQGICPDGWRVPTDQEWCSMATVLDGTVNCNFIGLTGTDAGGQLKEAGTTHWNAPNAGATNLSDFTGLPGGYYTNTDHSFNNEGCTGIFHTSSSNGAGRWAWQLNSDEAKVSRVSYIPGAYSVRCIRDANWTAQLTVTPASQDVTETAGTTTFDVSSNTSWTVAESVSWFSVSPANGSNNGAITVTYDANTSPDPRNGQITITAGGGAPVVNVTVTQAGNPWVCGMPITDARDNKTYTTVQIGTQCWMAQNLNIGTRIDGTGDQTNNETIEKYCYSNLETNCDLYGGLYQWNEMMQYSTTPGVQGICTLGWHVPSDAEWTTMSNFVSSQPAYLCNSDINYIAKALAATTNWNISTNTCAIGNNLAANNGTGFSGLPAGFYSSGSFSGQGSRSNFWSATQVSSGFSWYRFLIYSNAIIGRNSNTQSHGYSVRCLKD